MALDAARVPVIVGIGEVKDRPADPMQGREPLALMAEAARRAEADAGAALLARVDALDIVHEVSWPYADCCGLLSEALGMAPAHRFYGPVGGETPVRFLHEAAQRIADGTSQVALVCGAEAQHTASWAERNKVALPWHPRDPAFKPRTREYLSELMRRHNLDQPIRVYPLYENAAQAAWGQTPEQGQAESAAVWAKFSAVAADNPNSWISRRWTAEEIATPSPQNRLIAWPYPKLQVANPMVNQGAAVLVCSLAVARAAGIPAHRMVPILGGAAANEPKDVMQRDLFTKSHAQDVVLAAAVEIAGDAALLRHREFYSCFPVVPKMARRSLGLPEGASPTVAGGLTFHGAPLNNYMLHAACGMVRALRGDAGALGLLYGQGGFVTQHRSLVLGGEPRAALVTQDLQAAADARRGRVPPLVEGRSGEAVVETHTVVFRHDGSVEHGAVVVRLADASRSIARVPAEDTATLDVLMAPGRSAIGRKGRIQDGKGGLQTWSI